MINDPLSIHTIPIHIMYPYLYFCSIIMYDKKDANGDGILSWEDLELLEKLTKIER